MTVMMGGIHISQEIFAIDVLTALKSENHVGSMFYDCYNNMTMSKRAYYSCQGVDCKTLL